MQEEGNTVHNQITMIKSISEHTSNAMVKQQAQFEDFYRDQMEKMAQLSNTLKEAYGDILGSLLSTNWFAIMMAVPSYYRYREDTYRSNPSSQSFLTYGPSFVHPSTPPDCHLGIPHTSSCLLA
jgi:hypothetical protein